MSRDAIPEISIERLSNAIAAMETIAPKNTLWLEQRYDTTASDVMTVTQLARAQWYRTQGNKR